MIQVSRDYINKQYHHCIPNSRNPIIELYFFHKFSILHNFRKSSIKNLKNLFFFELEFIGYFKKKNKYNQYSKALVSYQLYNNFFSN